MAEAELRRRDALGAAVAWTLVDDPASATGLADPVADATARTLLQTLVTALDDPASEATLAALAADVANGLDVSDTAVLAKVEAVRALLAATLSVDTGLDLSPLATEATLSAVLGQLDDATADTVLSVLKALHATLSGTLDVAGAVTTDVDLTTVEGRLEAIRLLLAGTLTVQGAVTTDVDTSALATEATLEAVRVLLTGTLAVSGPLTNAELRDAPVTVAGDALGDIKRALTDYETRLDYDARTDGNPVYVGKAPQGTLTTATEWTIQRLAYDASNRLTRAQVLGGAWDNRAALGWT